MNLKRFLVIFGIAVALSGCAATYTLEGAKYDNKEAFRSAAETHRSAALANIQPLPKSLTDKSLIFAFPSAEVLITASKQRFTKIENRQPTGIAKEILENIPYVNHRLITVFGDAVERRGIYKSVKHISLESMNSHIQPTTNEDVIYFIEPTLNSGQWFYASIKHGKQVFAYDRTREGIDGKISAFLEAVQAQAIRD